MSVAGQQADLPLDVELIQTMKRFGDVVAVDRVDLAIRRGEFFSLLGPSGCGKTTILRMIAGFETPSEGEIRLRGVVANNIPPYRRPTNLVFQQLALFPHMDVFENVAFGLRVRREGRESIRRKVLQALELVQLSGLEHRRVRQLSGGQQQRVAIARALVNEPSVLLLDEPLGSLDLKLRVQMQYELKALQHRLGTTFIYVTHDQGEALTMSDRLAVIRQGRIEQLGTPREVYLQPSTAFVANFIGESNLWPSRVEEAMGEGGQAHVEGVGICAVAIMNHATGTHLMIRPEHVRIGDEAHRCRNQFTGTISESIFQGPVLRTVITLEAGGRVVAHSSPRADKSWQAGDSVVLGWEPADNVLVTI